MSARAMRAEEKLDRARQATVRLIAALESAGVASMYRDTELGDAIKALRAAVD
jgi:hypothetical protein